LEVGYCVQGDQFPQLWAHRASAFNMDESGGGSLLFLTLYQGDAAKAWEKNIAEETTRFIFSLES
jgi:hypothetical protein